MKIRYEKLTSILDVLQGWHGGSWTATYAVMTSVYAHKDVDTGLARDAARELRQTRRKVPHASKRDLDAAISRLELTAREAERGHYENPDSFSKGTTAAVLIAGIGAAAVLAVALWPNAKAS